MSRFKTHYDEKVVPALMEKFGYKNVMLVPKLEKIVVNCVTKDAVLNSKVVDGVMADLSAITGQKPVVSKAKKSVAAFKVREGQALGANVTLRRSQMYEFLDRLITFTLPRVRDFRGISPKAFDGRGNYNLGLTEQIVFPEIEYDKIDKVRGLGITMVTTAKTNDEGRELLKLMGLPFKK